MRFREFNRIAEAIPAVGRDLKLISPDTIQMVKKLGSKTADTIAVAAGQKEKPSPATTDIQVPPNLQAQMKVQPTAVQQAQRQASQQQTKTELPKIPTVGSQLVLPDKDTKKPASFTIDAQRGNKITLAPVKSNPNDPVVKVDIDKNKLQQTLAAVDPNNTVGVKK